MKKNEQPTPPATVIAIDLGAMYTRVAEIWAEEPLLEIPSLIAATTSGWQIGESLRKLRQQKPTSIHGLHDFLFDRVELNIGGKLISAQEVVTGYLQKLNAIIEKELSYPFYPGCICIPANLPVSCRELFRKICGQVWPQDDFPQNDPIQLVSSTTLAAASYFTSTAKRSSECITGILCDIGYGSADISVFDYSMLYLEDASIGVSYCTGKNLQNLLMEKIYRKYPFLSWPWPGKYNDMKRLEYTIQEAMASFSDSDPIHIPFPFAPELPVSQEKEAVFTREEIQKILQSEANGLADEILRLMIDSIYDWSDISKIFLCGYMAAFPEIAGQLSNRLGIPVEILDNPGNAAVMGAASWQSWSSSVRMEPSSFWMSDNMGRIYQLTLPQTLAPINERLHIVVPEDLEHWEGVLRSGDNAYSLCNPAIGKRILKKEELQKLQYQFDVVLEETESGEIAFYTEPTRVSQ